MGWWPWQFHDSPAKIFPSNTITLRPARPQPLQCNQRKTVEQVYQCYHLAFMRWRIFQTGSPFILTRTHGVRPCHYPLLTTKEKKSQRDDITWPRSRRCKPRSRIWIWVCQTIKPTFLSAMILTLSLCAFTFSFQYTFHNFDPEPDAGDIEMNEASSWL